MSDPLNQVGMNDIFHMLFSLATGNTSVRIEEKSGNDELQAIAELLNAVADHLEETLSAIAFKYTCRFYQDLVQLTFVLNANHKLVSFNTAILKTLKYKPEDIAKLSFEKLLAESSMVAWKTILKDLGKDPNFHSTYHLIFITADKQLYPSVCTVSRMLYSKMIVINSISTNIDKAVEENVDPTKTEIKSAIIRNLHSYILSHLEEPLPTLYELSIRFGTEEHHLKNGFRKIYKTSIYNFYHLARLTKAHALILQTSKPLKEISYLSGFKGYMNFYKAFRKHFGYPPSDLARSTMPEE